MDRPLDTPPTGLDVNGPPATDVGHDQPNEPRRDPPPAKHREHPLGRQALKGLALVDEKNSTTAALEPTVE
eukprot:5155716-Alexandrium_andersonii.AAC.1